MRSERARLCSLLATESSLVLCICTCALYTWGFSHLQQAPRSPGEPGAGASCQRGPSQEPLFSLWAWASIALSLSRGFGVRFVVVRGCAEFVLAGLVGSGGSGLRGRRRSMALSGGHFQETNKKSVDPILPLCLYIDIDISRATHPGPPSLWGPGPPGCGTYPLGGCWL